MGSDPAQESVPVYYANGAQLSLSGYDLTITFVRSAPSLGGDGRVRQIPEQKVQCMVQLSPPHMKVLVAMLADQLRHYESTIGAIPTPDHAPEASGQAMREED